MAKLTREELEAKAIEVVKQHKANHEHGIVFITENIAFEMKNLVRQLRKNFWGIYNRPIDPVTGRKKIWSPLTRFVVDTTDKNSHISQKDIRFRAKKENRTSLSRIVRGYAENQMRKLGFSDKMEELRKGKYIDGTSIVRVTKVTGSKEGITADLKRVDRLNFTIDGTAESIQKAQAVSERDPMLPSDVKLQKGWINTEDVVGTTNISKNDVNSTGSADKLVEVERYEGLAPKFLITGESEDTELINQRIIVSGIGNGPRVHLVEKLKRDMKTYEENWSEKIPGRWDGLGPAEKVMMMQLYQNITLNTRIAKNSVASLGLFKIKRQSGVTPQSINKLVANGAIKVNDMGDLEQIAMQEASPASYRDEEVATLWAQRDTNAFDAATGEQGKTTTATEAAITARSAGSSFDQLGKAEGQFWERVFNNHLMPIWGKAIKKNDIVRLTLDGEELRKFDLELADMAADEFIEEQGKKGVQFIDVEEIEEVKRKTIADVANGDTDRYETALGDVDMTDYDVEAFVKTDRFDSITTANGLLQLMQIDPTLSPQVLTQLSDIWGINIRPTPQQPLLPGQQPQVVQPKGAETETGNLTMQGEQL